MSCELLSLRRDDHSCTLMKTLEGLLENNVLVDCTLAAGGQFLKAHQIILSSCSPYFQLLFTQDMNKHPIIVFKDIEYKYLKKVLEYIYRGKVQVPQAQLNTFLEVANFLQIVGLDATNRYIISEESGSQIADSSVRGNANQISQQSSADKAVSNPKNIINFDSQTNLGPTPPTIQTNARNLNSSTIHIQSVYTLTSESPSTPNNFVAEDCVRSCSKISNNNIKLEHMSVHDNHNGRVINSTEQTSVSSGTVKSLRNKYSYSDCMVHAKQINSDESLPIKPVSGHNPGDKHIRKSPFTSGPETRETNANSVGNVSGSTKPVKSTEKEHFPKIISLVKKVKTKETGARNVTDTTEFGERSIQDVETRKRKNILPECVVKAERITIVKDFEKNSPSIQQQKGAKFRIKHPRKDFEECCIIEKEKSTEVPVKDIKSDIGLEKSLECATGHDINLPLFTKVSSPTKMSVDSRKQNSEGETSTSNSSPDGKSTVLSHAVNQPPSSSEKMWFCNICDKQLCNKSSFVDHMQLHEREKHFSCSKCGREFAHKNALQCHEQMHSNEKPYKCKNCDKSYAQSINLTRHMTTHSSKRPFKCQFCHTSYIQHNHLVRHLRTHAEERPFICNICERRFSMKENLITHIRIHTGEKPYECSICKKSFAQNSTLSRHLQTHSA